MEVNKRMEDLLHGDTRWLMGSTTAAPTMAAVAAGITSEKKKNSSKV